MKTIKFSVQNSMNEGFFKNEVKYSSSAVAAINTVTLKLYRMNL